MGLDVWFAIAFAVFFGLACGTLPTYLLAGERGRDRDIGRVAWGSLGVALLCLVGVALA